MNPVDEALLAELRSGLAGGLDLRPGELVEALLVADPDPTRPPPVEEGERLTVGTLRATVPPEVYEALLLVSRRHGVASGLAAVLRGGLWLLGALDGEGGLDGLDLTPRKPPGRC